MKSGKTGTILIIALVAAMLIVAGNSRLALRSIHDLDQSEAWVAHTWQVIGAVERVTNSFKDAESSYRGFTLTGDPLYVVTFDQAQQDLPVEVRSVEKLCADNPPQEQRVHKLGEMVEARMQGMERGIQASRDGSDLSRQVVDGGQGRVAMEEIRALAGEIQLEEQRLLRLRTAQSRQSANRAKATALLAAGLDLLLILLMFRFIVRERSLREKTDVTNDRLERLQTISDAALSQLTLEKLTTELLDRVRRVIEADCAVLCMWHNQEMRIQAASGVSIREGQLVPLTESNPLYQSAHQGRVVVIGDGPSPAIPIEELRSTMAAFLIMPVIASGEVKAALIAGRREPRAFSEQEQNLLSLVVDRIALSLDRANAYEAERLARQLAETRAEEVRTLNTELEARVQLRTVELEIANKELEAFSYSVSHDLRAPLRTVDGFSLALEEDYDAVLDATARDYLARIRGGVQHMGQLIDSLLQLSRITRAELTREPINITQMASEVMRELKQQNPGRIIDFSMEPGLEAMADPRLLRIALENLLGNSVKFTAKTAHAQISLGRETNSNAFVLRDNGAGFDMQYADKLFNAFQRLHGDKDFKGSGIGLATVARVIRRHHGSIRAEGGVGRGATFWFTLG